MPLGGTCAGNVNRVVAPAGIVVPSGGVGAPVMKVPVEKVTLAPLRSPGVPETFETSKTSESAGWPSGTGSGEALTAATPTPSTLTCVPARLR